MRAQTGGDIMVLPKRKKIRLEGYDYSSCGAYFVTICVTGHRALLWKNLGADSIRANERPTLSEQGTTIEMAIHAISEHYPHIQVDHYCIMPNHIHMLLRIAPDESGRMLSAPTLSTVIAQMKRWSSKQIGGSLWQKAFHDRIIRNEKAYMEAWQYIDQNPQKWQEDELYV
jgi:REP element-mobilizing transposase RayT